MRTPWVTRLSRVALRGVIVVILVIVVIGFTGSSRDALLRRTPSTADDTPRTSSIATITTTTTTLPVVAAMGGLGPLTSPPLPPPGPGFRSGVVTAVGDSVMIDAQGDLQHDIPGVQVNAGVSRAWSDGEAVLQQLKAAGQLGAVVVVGLGSNGPVTGDDFAQMMSILSGASRVVFVTVHVDQPWQDQVNRVLESGSESYPRVVIADWYTLSSPNPGWFGSDGTHLPVGGTGAQAFAQLIAAEV